MNMLTKADIKIIKDLLKNTVTKDDLRKYATKDDLKVFATKRDLERFATKDDFKKLSHDVVGFKDEILGEIRGLRDKVAVVTGYRDTLEDHEQRITKLESPAKTP